MKFYHATARKNLSSIAQCGLQPGTYLATDLRLAQFYAGTISSEGEAPCILEMGSESVKPHYMSPDLYGLSDPIMSFILDLHEGQVIDSEKWVHDQWKASNKSALSCIAIIGSLKADCSIAPSHINVIDEGPLLRLMRNTINEFEM